MKLNKTRYSTRAIIVWLWKHHKGCRLQSVINVVVGLLQVGVGLVGVEVLRQLTDIATHKQEGNLLLMAVIYVSLMLVEFLCNISHTWLAAILGVKSQNLMQQQFFARLLKGKWSGIERFHSGDVLNRLFGDVSDIVNLMTEVLPFIVTLLVQFIASLVYLLLMDASLAYILVIASPLFLILSRLYFRRMRRIVRKVKDSNSSLQATIQESIQHKMVIKVMEMADEMVSRLEKRQSLLRWQIKKRAKLSILTRTIVFVGFKGSALVALTYGLFQLQDGLITVGVLMAFTQLINRIQHPLLDMGRLLPVLVNSFTSSERLMELEELPLETDEEGQELEVNESTSQQVNKNENVNVNVNKSSSTIQQSEAFGISFDNVTYRYSQEGREVLHQFSHTFPARSFTAVLGETGAGKTTLLRLMLSLVEPQEGQVVLTSGDRQIKPNRRYFSYVPQGNTLFSGTIRDNLLFGNPKATSQQMYEALSLAKADFVRNLPRGLDTPCGEGGGGLSEGQSQRIAIARAILRPCKILLLDEATSALDVETEEALLTNLKRHYPDTTIVFVTHRLSAVPFATEQMRMHSLS